MKAFLHLLAVPMLGMLLIGCGKDQPAATNTQQGGARGGDDKKEPRTRTNVERQQSLNNLKQLAIAMRSYQDANGIFPKGGTGISWRVELLPYLEQQPLYDEILSGKPDQKTIAARMPKVFTAFGHSKEPGMTHYQVFSGKNTMFPKEGLSLTIITNASGSTNTLMIVETADPVPWTAAKDLALEEGKPLPKLFPGGLLAAFADGHVEFIPPTATEDVLRALIDPYNVNPIRRSW